jgi:hypothetical protein
MKGSGEQEKYILKKESFFVSDVKKAYIDTKMGKWQKH